MSDSPMVRLLRSIGCDVGPMKASPENANEDSIMILGTRCATVMQ